MLERIIDLDKEVFIFLNTLGSQRFDFFWLLITKKTIWIPFFIFLLYLIYKKLGAKQTVFLLLFVAVLVTISDQTANLFKYGFQRLRPCNDPEINAIIRIVKPSKSFSFFSAHAANSMAVSFFLFLNFKKSYRYLWLLFIWPLVFGYSRIYLGLHFPIDILFGYLFGLINGYLIFKLYCYLYDNYLKINNNQ